MWIVARPGDRSQVVDSEFWPEELKGKVGLLFDAQKRLIGLEVLQASSHLPEAALDGRPRSPLPRLLAYDFALAGAGPRCCSSRPLHN